jgi:hypothetical protein
LGELEGLVDGVEGYRTVRDNVIKVARVGCLLKVSRSDETDGGTILIRRDDGRALDGDGVVVGVAVGEASVGVESDRVGGEADCNVVVAEPWDTEYQGVVPELGNKGEDSFMVTRDL